MNDPVTCFITTALPSTMTRVMVTFNHLLVTLSSLTPTYHAIPIKPSILDRRVKVWVTILIFITAVNLHSVKMEFSYYGIMLIVKFALAAQMFRCYS